jgi:serine/threonine protein kinase
MQYSKIADCLGNKAQLWNGHYQIRKEIGEGQYGHVFLARDINKGKGDINKRVAIKVLKSEEIDDDDDENDLESKIFFELYKMQIKD